MTGLVLPLWSIAAAWLVLCWLAIAVEKIAKRVRARRLREGASTFGASFPRTPKVRAGGSEEDWAA